MMACAVAALVLDQARQMKPVGVSSTLLKQFATANPSIFQLPGLKLVGRAGQYLSDSGPGKISQSVSVWACE